MLWPVPVHPEIGIAAAHDTQWPARQSTTCRDLSERGGCPLDRCTSIAKGPPGGRLTIAGIRVTSIYHRLPANGRTSGAAPLLLRSRSVLDGSGINPAPGRRG